MSTASADRRALAAFPLLTGAGVLAALAFPAGFADLRPAIVPLLGMVMFFMGTGLRLRDFAAVLRTPRAWCLALALQFTLMPLLAVIIGRAAGLSDALLAGLVLVGACPGGTASNVMCYLARANVALSVSLTSASTLLAVVMTPWLTWLCIGERVPVPVAGMLRSLALVIVLPVTAGVAVAHLAGRHLAPARHWFPLLSMAAIALIIAIIVGLNHAALPQIAGPAMLAVVLHNGVGLAVAWLAARALGLPAADVRAVALEVGMQNSGLGVALALRHFPAAAALPGALFSLWHNVTGMALAAVWRRQAS